MAQEEAIKLFEGKHIRYVWDEEQEKYYFSVVDVAGVLTDQDTTRGATIYWAVLKKRLKNEGADELITNCKQLKLEASDGKKRLTDVADTEQPLLRKTNFHCLKNRKTRNRLIVTGSLLRQAAFVVRELILR